MTIRLLLLVCSVLLNSSLYAQSEKSVFPSDNYASEDSIYTVVDEWPEYIGGNYAMNRFLAKNIRYPRDAEKASIDGRVIVGFTVSKSGALTDIHLLENPYPSLGAEALRVIKLMPAWKPGIYKGQLVNVKFKVDIVYRLPE